VEKRRPLLLAKVGDAGRARKMRLSPSRARFGSLISYRSCGIEAFFVHSISFRFFLEVERWRSTIHLLHTRGNDGGEALVGTCGRPGRGRAVAPRGQGARPAGEAHPSRRVPGTPPSSQNQLIICPRRHPRTPHPPWAARWPPSITARRFVPYLMAHVVPVCPHTPAASLVLLNQAVHTFHPIPTTDYEYLRRCLP
jgi:hypothetical protein